MKIKLLSVGTPTANGRIYPKEVLEAAIKKADKDKMIAVFNQDMPTADVNIEKAAAIINELELTDDSLYGTVSLLQTPMGLLMQQLGDSYECRPFGIGKVSDDKVVSDYELRGFSIVPSES
jgi:hypothetical protein